MLSRGLDITLPSSFTGLECATLPDDAEERIKLVGESRSIFMSMGAGPWCTAPTYPLSVDDTIKTLEKEITLYGADAVGECGFDFHWTYGSVEDQERLFSAQSEMAKSLSVPLIIHSRDADEMLRKHLSLIDDRTIMHCFSSDRDMMETLLERGAYISFAGNVTYKNNKAIQEAAAACPVERLLYETDSPYLTPVPKRGEANRPENTEYTLLFLSSLRGEDPEYIRDNALRNFFSLMKNGESVVRREIRADHPVPVVVY